MVAEIYLVLVIFKGQVVEQFVGGQTVSDCYARIESYVQSHAELIGVKFVCKSV